MIHRLQLAAFVFVALLAIGGVAQTPAPPSTDAVASAPEQPLPEINSLMRQVEANERKSEDIQKNYLYREQNTLDERDSHNGVKKTATREVEVFWLNGIQVVRTLKRDGRELSPEEKKKEDEKIDERVKKAQERREKADANGKETDSRGHDEITFARMLELGSFTNARRVITNGRPTILIDYAGDPKAKTHSYAEGVFRELSGTVWVDEQDKTLVRLEGQFTNDFHVGGGLVVNVKKGTWFKANFLRVNDEVWLPERIEADGHARYLLFFSLNGHFAGSTSDYRKFKATSTILPAIDKIRPEPTPQPVPPPPK